MIVSYSLFLASYLNHELNYWLFDYEFLVKPKFKSSAIAFERIQYNNLLVIFECVYFLVSKQ